MYFLRRKSLRIIKVLFLFFVKISPPLQMDKLNWNQDKAVILAAYYTATNASNLELIRIAKENYQKLEKVYPLIEYVLERTNAVAMLIEQDLLWDADIIIRSALETLSKFMFIADSEEETREALLNEYWKDLSEIYSIKLHEQAKKNLKYTSSSETHRLSYSALLFSEEDELRLKSKWTKSERSKLEQKWSFTGIINHLSKKNKDNAMEIFEFLTHSYRMSSHITHGDEFGVSLILERKSRSEQERNDIHIAHYLRLVSDCFDYCLMTAIYTTKYLNVSPKYFLTLFESLSEINLLTKKYHSVPFNDKIYDKFR